MIVSNRFLSVSLSKPQRSWIAAALLCICVLDGCKAKPKENVSTQPSNPNEVSVTPMLAQNLRFGTPQMTDVTGTLQVAAHVETDARSVAHVGSPVAGRIL